MRYRTIQGGIALALLAACGGGSTTSSGTRPPVTGGDPPPPSSTPATTASVDVMNYQFSPNSVTIQAGGTVTWTWVDSGHSVTSFGSPAFAPNAPVSNAGHVLAVTFPTTGDYQYLCSVHGTSSYGYAGGMAGVVYVR